MLSCFGVLLGLIATASAFTPSLSQLPTKSIRSHSSVVKLSCTTRRSVLSGLATLPFFPLEQAFADSTGKFSSKRTAKNRYVPRIQKGMTSLEAFEAGGDVEIFLSSAEDMVSAMKLYGQVMPARVCEGFCVLSGVKCVSGGKVRGSVSERTKVRGSEREGGRERGSERGSEGGSEGATACVLESERL